ncbi:hypothetical protein Daus18300_009795 [Diaporthe australafricana]|uniref:Hypersensitive response-inducing protein n=1 Tax=Diaporthe australafricana TaxID=127596 RepID=A0ABR3WDB9_9PEZI
MKFSVATSAFLLALASATPIKTRTIAQEFDVSEFSAGCIPHGTLCSFSFNVATNQMPYQTNCNASFTVAYNLPNVDFTACADPSIVWAFRGIPDATTSNYTLTLLDADQSLAAVKIWDIADFPVINAGSTVYQQYSGPARFVVQ